MQWIRQISSLAFMRTKLGEKESEEGKVLTIVVEGYTDSAGDAAYNLKLSEERAQTVANYMTASYPELTNTIAVVGNGKNNLILDEQGKEDAAASRRVEVRYVLNAE